MADFGLPTLDEKDAGWVAIILAGITYAWRLLFRARKDLRDDSVEGVGAGATKGLIESLSNRILQLEESIDQLEAKLDQLDTELREEMHKRQSAEQERYTAQFFLDQEKKETMALGRALETARLEIATLGKQLDETKRTND